MIPIKADKYEYRVSWSEEDQVYIARVAEFPSIAAHGDTSQEAISEIQFVVEEVLKDMKELNEDPPEPLNIKEYSGKLTVKMPISLHRKLEKEAAWEKVSLNQLVITKLAS